MRNSNLESFVAIYSYDAGYGFLTSDNLQEVVPFCDNPSIWHYIYQSNELFGLNLWLKIMWALENTSNAEVVECLVPRLCGKLLNHQESGPRTPEWTRYTAPRHLVRRTTGQWLNELIYPWFYNEDRRMKRAFFCEYKLTQILKQLSCIPNYHHSWHDPAAILMDCVETIIMAFCWSTKASNAVFRRWSKIILDCGIDLYAIRQQTTGNNAFRRRTVNCCMDTRFEIVYGD